MQASGPGGNQTIGYSGIGNITSRSDVGGGAAWTYHATKKHAVTAAGGVSYGYDANGNMTSRGGATITWTAGNMPAEINGNGFTAEFEYTPDRSRWRQTSTYPDGTETTVYIGGLMEKLIKPANTTYKHLIPTPSGFVQYIRRPGGFTATYYMASDHLGSTDAVLNSPGTVMVRPSFAAFGARRDDDWNGLPSAAEIDQIEATSRRGFTGHEMLDNVGLVHMNGRVYDPAIGRFISADPFIDCFDNPQGWNRYAYVKSRPLSSVDPTGFESNDRPNTKPVNALSLGEVIVVTAERIRPDRPSMSITGGAGIGSVGASGEGGRRGSAAPSQPRKRSEKEKKECMSTCTKALGHVTQALAAGAGGAMVGAVGTTSFHGAAVGFGTGVLVGAISSFMPENALPRTIGGLSAGMLGGALEARFSPAGGMPGVVGATIGEGLGGAIGGPVGAVIGGTTGGAVGAALAARAITPTLAGGAAGLAGGMTYAIAITALNAVAEDVCDFACGP